MTPISRQLHFPGISTSKAGRGMSETCSCHSLLMVNNYLLLMFLKKTQNSPFLKTIFSLELIPSKLQLSVLNNSWVECKLEYETTRRLMKKIK